MRGAEKGQRSDTERHGRQTDRQADMTTIDRLGTCTYIDERYNTCQYSFVTLVTIVDQRDLCTVVVRIRIDHSACLVLSSSLTLLYCCLTLMIR